MWGGSALSKIYFTGPRKLATIPLSIPLKSPMGAQLISIKLPMDL
jgi:hypothetical protein